MKIPNGHQTIMPYLILNKAIKFIDFAKAVFNAELTFSKMRDDNEALLMHAEISIGGSTIMFGDEPNNRQPQTANLFIYVENADETYKIALDNGATTVREPSDQDYGRTCGVTDPFGNVWWITSLK